MTFEEIMADELGSAVQLDEVIDDTACGSLEYLQFVQELERHFHITIPDASIAKAETFRQLKAVVDELRVVIQ
jgi:acyl carrier protein